MRCCFVIFHPKQWFQHLGHFVCVFFDQGVQEDRQSRAVLLVNWLDGFYLISSFWSLYSHHIIIQILTTVISLPLFCSIYSMIMYVTVHPAVPPHSLPLLTICLQVVTIKVFTKTVVYQESHWTPGRSKEGQ